MMRQNQSLTLLVLLLLRTSTLFVQAQFQQGSRAGEVPSAGIKDVSGLAASRRNEGLLWLSCSTYSGNAKIHATTTLGGHVAAYELQDATSGSPMEQSGFADMSVGPGPESGRSYIYLLDAAVDSSENSVASSADSSSYQCLRIYRVPEPAQEAAWGESSTTDYYRFTTPLPGVDTIKLVFPRLSNNDEDVGPTTLLVDQISGEIVVSLEVVDTTGGSSSLPQHIIYSTPPGTASTPGSFEVIVQPQGYLNLEGGADSPIAGDVSLDGADILVQSIQGTHYYPRIQKSQILVAEAMIDGQGFGLLPYQDQGQAIAFASDNTGYYTIFQDTGSTLMELYFYARESLLPAEEEHDDDPSFSFVSISINLPPTTPRPTISPSPSQTPSSSELAPTDEPTTDHPTNEPTPELTNEPTPKPTIEPTIAPSDDTDIIFDNWQPPGSSTEWWIGEEEEEDATNETAPATTIEVKPEEFIEDDVFEYDDSDEEENRYNDDFGLIPVEDYLELYATNNNRSTPTADSDVPTTATPTAALSTPPTYAPTASPTSALSTPPTDFPTTDSPTSIPTTAGPTDSPTTASPTVAPTTASPTTAEPTQYPTTMEPSPVPTTAEPTMAPTPTPPPVAPKDEPFIPGLLTHIEHGLLLSSGLNARILARTGEWVNYADGTQSEQPFHKRPDFGACFDDTRSWNPGGWVYLSNSEAKKTSEGGVGSLVFDAEGNLIKYELLLTHTTLNCGGGKTPWNTWVSCEEKKGGLAYQVDPMNSIWPAYIVLGEDGGGFWESFACDDRDKNKPYFFVTEDQKKGALVRFTPDPQHVHWHPKEMAWNMLHSSKTEDYLVLIPRAPETQASQDRGGTFEWTTNYTYAKENAFLYYPESEGIDFYNGRLYFVCKSIKRMFVLHLDNGQYERESTSEGLFDGAPDQVARILDNGLEDFLFFTEEGGVDAGIHGRDSNGVYFTLLESPDYHDETTGLAFSPDLKHIYVAYQENGLVFDVTRQDGAPLSAMSLNLKYHSMRQPK